MEGEHYYELRSRSRSRSETPQVHCTAVTDAESIEHHYDLRQMSRERSYTPGEVSRTSRRSSSRSTTTSSVRKVVDKNTDSIAEQFEESLGRSVKNTQKPAEKSAVLGVKKTERRSERQKAKRQIFANGQNEAKDNKMQHKNITDKSDTATSSKTVTSDYYSDGEKDDLPSKPKSAYEIYKQAGEWWNVFPKTDYTYSETSKCRYEIAPGIMAMPNMSRRSIHSNENNSVDSNFSITPLSSSQSSKANSSQDFLSRRGRRLLENDDISSINSIPQLLSYTDNLDMREPNIIHREVQYGYIKRQTFYTSIGDSIQDECTSPTLLSWNFPPSRHFKTKQLNSDILVDSDVDMNDSMRVRRLGKPQTWKNIQWLKKIVTFLIKWFFTVMDIVTLKKFTKRDFSASHDYRLYQESKWSRVWRSIDRYLQYLYLLLVKVLLLDCWLLSWLSPVRDKMPARRFKVLWLVLLPLILLLGTWFPIRAPLITPSSLQKSEDMFFCNEIMFHDSVVRDERDSLGEDQSNSLFKHLIERVKKLEDGIVKQTKSLSIINQTLGSVKEGHSHAWVKFNEKLNRLDEMLRSENANADTRRELESVKFEFQSLRKMFLQTKSCCDTQVQTIKDDELENHINNVLKGYFGSALVKEEWTKVFQNLINIHNEEQIKSRRNDKLNEHRKTEVLNETILDVYKIVKEALKVYDADKTGRVDYALESAGGQIISTRCTQRYDLKTRAFKIMGWTLYYESNNPRTVIQGHPVQPGICWAFQDFPGYLLIKTRSLIHVTGFTMEHAPKSILPNADMRSAPRKFNVWGLTDENDSDPVMFGEYEFANSDESLQYFSVQNTTITTPFNYVELRIHSNHGQLEYTCLYRFRIHGNSV